MPGEAACVLITGMPGAGKTAVTRLLAKRFDRFTTVLDTVIPERAQYDLIAGLLAPRRIQVVVLAPGIEVCRERNRTRDPEERFDFDDYESLERRMHAALDGLAVWLDTASLTADESADLVADRVRTTS